MSTVPQKRALRNYRRRLKERGMARFEILGLQSDRELLRSLARRLSEEDRDAKRFRGTLKRFVADAHPTGGILAALRRSPLVGTELDLRRSVTRGRAVDL